MRSLALPPPQTRPGVRVLRTRLTSRLAWRLLLFELNRVCGERGVQHREIGARIGVSRASVSQALKGVNLFSRPAIEVIADFFDAEDLLPFWLELHDLARSGAREDSAPSGGTWDPDLEVALEAVAAAVTVVDFTAIPALLQTQSYARLLHRWHPREAEDLLRRQQVLTADPQARLTWFTDEYALRRQFATAPEPVARHQFQHLARLAETGMVDLRVVPMTRALPQPPPPFTLIRLDDGHTTAHERMTTTTHSTGGPVAPSTHLSIIDSLDRVALDPTASHHLMQTMIQPGSERVASTA